MSRRTVFAVLAAFLATSSVAFANDPIGACCFPNGVCETIMVTPCEFDGGSFIGEGTTCAEIDCEGPVAVPILSIAGLVALFGALGSLGIYALVRRRSRH